MSDQNNFNSNLSIVDEESINYEDSKYGESLDIIKSVLDRLDEFTGKNTNNDSAIVLSSNQSNTLINSLSKINNSTISSILYSNNGKENQAENKNNPKMDSEYIINQLLKRRTEYRSIIDKKQNILKSRKNKLNKKRIKNSLNFITETNDEEKMKKNKSSELTAEERLRQFQEFSEGLSKQCNNFNAVNEQDLNNQSEFEIDNFHNYKFKARNEFDNCSMNPLSKKPTIESWNQEEILENYEEILEKYLIYSSNFKNQIDDGNESTNGTGNGEIDDNSQFFNNSIFSKKPQEQSLKMSLIVGLIVALGGLVYGFDSGLVNNLIGMSYFVEHFQTGNNSGFTNSQISIIVTSLSIGTFTGALVAPFSMDRVGRKPTIIASVWVFW